MPENRRKKEPFRHMAEKPLLLFKCKINAELRSRESSDAVIKEREGLFIIDQVLRRHVLFHLPQLCHRENR